MALKEYCKCGFFQIRFDLFDKNLEPKEPKNLSEDNTIVPRGIK